MLLRGRSQQRRASNTGDVLEAMKEESLEEFANKSRADKTRTRKHSSTSLTLGMDLLKNIEEDQISRKSLAGRNSDIGLINPRLTFSNEEELDGEEELSPPTILEYSYYYVLWVISRNRRAYRFAVNSFYLFMYYVVSVTILCQLEEWRIIDAVYFLTQTITTVGYGNITPVTDGGKIFAMISIFVGIVVIFSIISEVVYVVFIEGMKHSKKIRKNRTPLQITVKRTYESFLWVILLVLLLLLGSAVYVIFEDMTFLEAFYFSTYTCTGVGYGDISLENNSSIIFNCVYMVVSVSLTVYTIDKLSTLRTRIESEIIEEKLHKLPLSVQLLDGIHSNSGSDIIHRSDYVLYMLELTGAIDHFKDVEPYIAKFREFDLDNNGILDDRDIKLYNDFHSLYEEDDDDEANKKHVIRQIFSELIKNIKISLKINKSSSDEELENRPSVALRKASTEVVTQSAEYKENVLGIQHPNRRASALNSSSISNPIYRRQSSVPTSSNKEIKLPPSNSRRQSTAVTMNSHYADNSISDQNFKQIDLKNIHKKQQPSLSNLSKQQSMQEMLALRALEDDEDDNDDDLIEISSSPMHYSKEPFGAANKEDEHHI
jgi:hypothetical protein